MWRYQFISHQSVAVDAHNTYQRAIGHTNPLLVKFPSRSNHPDRRNNRREDAVHNEDSHHSTALYSPYHSRHIGGPRVSETGQAWRANFINSRHKSRLDPSPLHLVAVRNSQVHTSSLAWQRLGLSARRRVRDDYCFAFLFKLCH